MATAEEQLADLLLDMYDADELRVFLGYRPDGEKIGRRLPGSSASALEVAAGAVKALVKLRRLDHEFFGALIEDRENWEPEIKDAALRFGVDLDAPANVVPFPAPAGPAEEAVGTRGRRTRRTRLKGPPPDLGPIKRRFALLVGIEKYDDPEFRDVRYAVEDVGSMQEVLDAAGYVTVTIHDDHEMPIRRPSETNILTELGRICDEAAPEDLVLVFFAGHGVCLRGKHYLMLPTSRKASTEDSALPLSKVEERLKTDKWHRRVLIIDACQAGPDMERGGEEGDFTHNVNDLAEGFVLLSASTAGQAASESLEKKHGIFTHFVLEALRGEADPANDGYVTVNDVHEHALNGVTSWYLRKGLAKQKPAFRAEGWGDMILADYRGS